MGGKARAPLASAIADRKPAGQALSGELQASAFCSGTGRSTPSTLGCK
jgi:hypothetical protein